MKNSSLFTRLFLGNMALVAVMLLLGGIVATLLLSRHEIRQTERRQKDVLEAATLWIQQIPSLTLEEVQRRCEEFPLPEDMRLTVVATDGQVLGDTQYEPKHMERHDTRPEVKAAIEGVFGQDSRESKTVGIEYRYYALPVVSGDDPEEIVAVCRIAMQVMSLEQGQQLIYNILLGSAVVMVLAAMLLALLINWIWSRPLRVIATEASRIASGDLDHKPPIEGARELVQLAVALDHMRCTVSRQIQVIRNQRERLMTILSHLNEAIVATGDDGNIVFINPSANELFEPEQEPIGLPLQSVVRHPRILDICGEAQRSDQPIRRQIEADLHGRRYILQVDVECTVDTPSLPQENDDHGDSEQGKDVAMLLVLNDLTSSIRVGQMKTDFVANASHELRTPLATLRAAVETLLETELDDGDSVRHIIGIVDRHVARLEEMVEDLLDLHLVENTSADIQQDEIMIPEMLTWIKAHQGEKAHNREVNLQLVSEPEEFTVNLSRKHLKLIVRNLVDNAIKFTPPGGEVDVRFELTRGYLVVTVKDTGCGIPPEEQPKVFDRFYQVDQSRHGDSRQRGTGLGLAIVKHAVDRLEGDVALHSRVERGTTVTIHLPLE